MISGTFTLLAYYNESGDVAVPSTWDDADPHLIDRGKVEQVRLRSFSTNVHSLEVSLRFRAIRIEHELRADTHRPWWHIVSESDARSQAQIPGARRLGSMTPNTKWLSNQCTRTHLTLRISGQGHDVPHPWYIPS